MKISYGSILISAAATFALVGAAVAECSKCSLTTLIGDQTFFMEDGCKGATYLEKAPANMCFKTVCTNPARDIWVNVEGEAFNQVRIIVHRNDKTHELFHPIGLGTDYKCGSDVQIGNNYVVVRHGDKRDLVAMYGIKSSGEIVGTGAHIRDDAHHGIELGLNNFIVRFGRLKDNTTRFCFSDNGWEVSVPEARNHAVTNPCNSPYSSSLTSN
ncbi:MAG: hypothetical protein R3D32_02465 [Nitratireductor sp.]